MNSLKHKDTVISINLCNVGSTGLIAKSIGKLARTKGYNHYFVYPGHKLNEEIEKNDVIVCTDFWRKCIEKIAYYTGIRGCWMWFSTWKVLKKINSYKPNIIHLHNLHDTYINLPMLFNYIKKHNIPVVWTLHDCWAFTGQCPHFTMVKCDKWKTGCYDCPQYRQYPASCVDRTKTMWKLKKKWFTGVQNMTIVTPSQWLSDLVKESFLKEYPVKVINNGIDLNVFKPTESDFRDKYGLQNKKIILGVAFGWGERKGLDVFVELAKRLDEQYQIILVGTDDDVDKYLPSDIISIHRTQNQHELAVLYSVSDIFVNPTREEVLGMVNVEALACGTPVITFNSGGSPECIDKSCGVVVKCDDVDAMEREIKNLCFNNVYDKTSCLERAKYFDNNVRFKEYISLYDTVVGG